MRGKEIGELGIDVLLNIEHVGGFPFVSAVEQRSNPAGAIVGSKIAGDRIFIIDRKWILIRGDDHARGGIVKLRKILKRDKALPFAFS